MASPSNYSEAPCTEDIRPRDAFSQASASRLEEISRATDELALVRALRPVYPEQLDGLMLAEMDWLGELHRLIHN